MGGKRRAWSENSHTISLEMAEGDKGSYCLVGDGRGQATGREWRAYAI